MLALLAAALAARKRIAWWILRALHGRPRSSGTSSTWSPATTPVVEDVGETHRPGLRTSPTIVLLVLARGEFWAKVRRGALFKAAAVLVAGMAIGILVGWGLLELFPGSLARDDRLPYAVNRVSAFAGADPDLFAGQSARASSTRCSACSARWR